MINFKTDTDTKTDDTKTDDFGKTENGSDREERTRQQGVNRKEKKMNPFRKQVLPIEQATGQYLKQKNVTSPPGSPDVLSEERLTATATVKAKHASQRLKAEISAYPRNRMPDSKTEEQVQR